MIKRLVVFDFDGTLIDSPEKESGKLAWAEKMGKPYPYLGWWGRVESLDLRIFDIKPFPSVLNQLKKEKLTPDTYVIILTSRMEKLRPEVQAVLDANKIYVSKLDMKRSEKTKGEKILRYIQELPDLEEISVYEDRDTDIASYEAIRNQIPENITFNIYVANQGNLTLTETSMKLLKIINEEMSNFLDEQFDSPEAKERFKNLSPEEIKNMTNIQSYKNQFDSNFYQGRLGADLHDLVGKATFRNKEEDALASADIIYKTLIQHVPEFKNFELDNEHSDNKPHDIFLKKEIQIKNEKLSDDYSVKVQLWIDYHTKSDKYLDYKKYRIKVLFSPQIVVTRTSIDFFDVVKLPPPSSTGEEEFELSDEFVDDAMTRLSKSLYGSPDKEDDYFEEKYKLLYRNLQYETFIKILPKLRNNLLEFNKYVQKKYGITV